MLDIGLLQTHVLAYIRDQGGSIMSICSRLELCLMDECVAVYEGRRLDTHYWVKGCSFYVFNGSQTIKMDDLKINFSARQLRADLIDCFDVSSYDFCELAKALHHRSKPDGDWRCTSINKELATWLDRHGTLDPHILSFLHSPNAERRIY